MQIDDYDDVYEGEIDTSDTFTFTPVQPISRETLTNKLDNLQSAFHDDDFLEEQGLPEPNIPYTERKEALSIFLDQSEQVDKPSTPGAARALNKLLTKFDYTLSNSNNKMRQYVVYKLFEIAENDDPKIALKALEMLGKVSEVALFTTKVEVSSVNKSTKDLESELSSLMQTYSIGADITAIDVEYEEISDEELRGDVEDYEEEIDEDEDE